MSNQIWKHLVFTCTSLGITLKPSLGPAHNIGELSRPDWFGSRAKAGIRWSAMFALLALGAVSAGLGQSAATGTTRQTNPVAKLPRDQAREDWRNAMLHNPPQKEKCSTSSYPEKQWHEVPCGPAPKPPVAPRKLIRPHVGGELNNDLTFKVENGYIVDAEGSFDKVAGVTSEQSNSTPNAFSLQLNTNIFKTSACNGSPAQSTCRGWVQFVYTSSGKYAFIQYWLIGYGSTCPAGWASDGDYNCSRNSHTVNIPAMTIADLRKLKLYGVIGDDWGIPNPDSVAIQIGDAFYEETSGDPIAGARAGWQEMEFNVFGDGGSTNAVFNPGSTLTVRDSILLGTGNTYTCTDNGTSGESNNLILSAKSPLEAEVGPPSLVFIESNAKGTVYGGCKSAVVIGETHHFPAPIVPHRP